MGQTIRREDLIGTIFSSNGREVILTELTGEGSENVVYTIAPLDDPTAENTVIRFKKPQPFFEMRTLNHSFRVHEELYPDHPLIMSPEDRMEDLADEMVDWIEDERIALKISLFRELYDVTFSFLGRSVEGTQNMEEAILAVIAKGGIPQLLADQNFLDRLEELQDEDLVEDGYLTFAEVLESTLRSTVAKMKDDGTFFPLSRCGICILLGLNFEGYISLAEAKEIARDPRIAGNMSERDLAALYFLVETLLSRARMARDKSIEAEDGMVGHEYYNALEACEFLGDIAECGNSPSPRHKGLALYSYANTLELIGGQEDNRRKALEEALEIFDRDRHLADRHNVLLSLALTYSAEAFTDRQAIVKELLEIRAVLEAGDE